jgi:hypothetical protein
MVFVIKGGLLEKENGRITACRTAFGELVLSRACPEQSRRVEGLVEPLVVSLSNQALPFDWLCDIVVVR